MSILECVLASIVAVETFVLCCIAGWATGLRMR